MNHRHLAGATALAAATAVSLALAGCSLPFAEGLPLGGSTPSVEDAGKALVSAMSPTVTDDSLVQAGTLTVGLDSSDAAVPFCVAADGEVTGLDVDVASIVAGEMGLQVRFVVVNDAAAAIGSECDVVTHTSAGAVSGATTIGSYAQEAIALYHKGEVAIAAKADLSGKACAVQDSSASQTTVESSDCGMTTKTYANLNEAFEALESGEVDHVACDAYSGAYLAATYDDIAFCGSLDTPADIGFAVSSSNEALAGAVGDALTAATEDGTMQIARNRWLGSLPTLVADTTIGGVKIDKTAVASSADKSDATSTNLSSTSKDGSTAGSNAVGAVG